MQELLWAIAWALCAYLIAEKRGYDKRWAVVGGLIFGPFASLYYLIRGSKALTLREPKTDDTL